jgi:hypothetical protein
MSLNSEEPIPIIEESEAAKVEHKTEETAKDNLILIAIEDRIDKLEK